jgi:DNA primase
MNPSNTRVIAAKAARQTEWQAERDRIDLAAVATNLLGPPHGRRGERGRRLWWRCPFHEDKNPSFCIDPAKPRWRCFGCNERGDAAALVMRLQRVTFPEAIVYLTAGRSAPQPGKAKSARRSVSKPAPTRPPERSGLLEADALALVGDAEARLWSNEGTDALAYLTGPRCLSAETIRRARLGWTPGASIPTRDGDRAYKAEPRDDPPRPPPRDRGRGIRRLGTRGSD